MPCIYVLFSKATNKKYIGSSREDEPTNRLRAHNVGKTKSTKAGRPWKLVYQEHLNNYSEARRREIFLKSGRGRKYLKDKIDLDLD